MSRLNFTLDKEASGSKARAATYQTLHGEVQTPIFMPVGTQATVKSQTVETLKATGANIVLANTYHLLLRPGPEVFKKFGGINPHHLQRVYAFFYHLHNNGIVDIDHVVARSSAACLQHR